MKNIRFFYLKIFIFLVVKFSVYFNRRVFVMKFIRTDNEDSDQTAQMRRLICSTLSAHFKMYVFSRCGSYMS